MSVENYFVSHKGISGIGLFVNKSLWDIPQRAVRKEA
jgi:hypothetical protein